MSQIVDNILAQVCLDERVKDGIFSMDEEQHMDALRDHLVKNGLTFEDARSVTNGMMESLNYPDRQAYRREDGIKVTWPSPQHKRKAMQENPGKYVEEEEAQRLGLVKDKEPQPEPEPKKDLTPPPSHEPAGEASPPIAGGEVDQAGQKLAIEPLRGSEKPETPPVPPAPPVQPPTTPERKAAEKTVVQQMMQTDDSAIYKADINENCIKQLMTLQEYAESKGLTEALMFLKKYVKS